MPGTKSVLTQSWFTGLRAAFYAFCLIFSFAWLIPQARGFDARLGFALPAATIGLGVVLIIAGAALMVSCVAAFVVRGRGTPAPFDAPRQFVAIGPYRYVRNPMYLGGFTLLFGLALYFRSISIVLMAAILALAVHLLVVLYEEPVLTRKFDGAYETYLAGVRRWLPRAPRAKAGTPALSL